MAMIQGGGSSELLSNSRATLAKFGQASLKFIGVPEYLEDEPVRKVAHQRSGSRFPACKAASQAICIAGSGIRSSQRLDWE